MLVLSRKANQTIIIGDITVVVIAVNGNRVKLGLSAPKNVAIHRDDIRSRLSLHGHTDAKTCDESADGIPPELRERCPPELR